MLEDLRRFDAENHHYEPLDAYTRHLDPKLRSRTVDVVRIGGRVRVVGGRIINSVTVDFAVSEPLDYSIDLQGFKPEVQQKILRDNTVGLTERAPV